MSAEDRFAGYTKVSVVGKGAFGTATLYVRESDKKEIVIKDVNIMEMPLEERQSALNEVKVLSSLHHPNIIKYFGSFENDGSLMIEMEYADGGTLAQFIDLKYQERKRLKELDVIHLFRQICSALAYMHRHNILHRDLKTANIFLTKYGCVKVGDFGISKMMTTLAQAHTVVGTPYYLSPEMCDFEPISERYSDNLQQLIDEILQKNTFSRPTAQFIHDVIIPRLLQDMEMKYYKSIGESNKPLLKERSVLYELKSFGTTATLEPIQLPCAKIIDIAVGLDHYLALTEDFKIYSWGDNTFGQLGHGDSENWKNYPHCIKTLTDKNIKQVSAGNAFSVFLTTLGVLMTTGNGKQGCLGHGDYNSVTRPRIINRLVSVNINQVASGSDHIMAVTANGILYSWGLGENGRLGLGDEENRCSPTVVKIPNEDKISTVFCGSDGTIVITATGILLACGNNIYNKLGISSIFKHCEKSLIFKRIRGVKHTIKDVYMGLNHTVFLTIDNSVMTLGRNKEGQLGRGHFKLMDYPREIDHFSNKVIMAACGNTYTVIGTIDNIVYLWGTRYNTISKSEIPASTSTSSNANTFSDLLNMNKEPITASQSLETNHCSVQEIIKEPKAIMGLYASPEHIADGELVWLVKLFALNNSILIWVNTTVPPATSFEKNWHEWVLEENGGNVRKYNDIIL